MALYEMYYSTSTVAAAAALPACTLLLFKHGSSYTDAARALKATVLVADTAAAAAAAAVSSCRSLLGQHQFSLCL